MKAFRLVLIGVSICALLLLVALAVGLNASFQTWAARRELAKRPELHGSIGRVSAGFSRTEVRALKLESQGAVLTLPSLDLELPAISAGLSRKVYVRSLVAKGWTLDLTKAAGLPTIAAQNAQPRRQPPSSNFSLLSSANAAEAIAPASTVTAAQFRGVLSQLQLPVDLSVDGVDLEGEVILPPQAGHGTSRLRVVLRGGGLGAGKDGAFRLDVAGAASDGGAMTIKGDLGARMDTPRTFTQFTSKLDSSVSGTQFPDGVTLRADVTAARSATGENYTVILAGKSKQLASLKADWVSSTGHIGGAWQIDLHDTDVAPFALGRKLPGFTADGGGTFETGAALDEIHATGSLKVVAERLELIRPELSAVGAANVAAEFDLLQHGDSIRVERLDATVSGRAPVASIHGLQSFEFNLKSGELGVADPAKDLVAISLKGLPLAWAQAFLGSMAVTGGDVRGEFSLSAREGGLALRPTAPLTIAGLSVTNAGVPALQDVDVSLQASADYTPRGWQAEVTHFTLSHAGASLLAVQAKAGQLSGEAQPVKATGHWTANLAELQQQPVVAGSLRLTAGKAEGNFSASLDGTKAIETKLTLSDLVAVTKEKLPVVTAELRADIAPTGKITFSAPLLFMIEDRKSDLLFAGTFIPGTPAGTIDARLSGEKVVAQDVQLLGLLVPAEEPVKKPGTPDAKPFWSAVNGQVTLAIRKVIYAGSAEVSDVGGTIRLDPVALSLENVRAVFGPESDLKLAGAMKFDAKAAGYTMAADLAVNNFDTAPAFKALDPAKLPTVEARVNFTGHVTGEGENVAKVAERARGRFEMTSKGGVFRALNTVLPADRLQTAQSALSVVSGLFGGGGGTGADVARITNEIVKYVSEIQFDQLSVSAERDANLNLLLKDFSLISPDVRLGGEGVVTYTPGKSLLQQALDLKLTLGARGRFGELLGQAKMLKAEKDNLGYTAFVTPIKVGGTLGHTDNSDFKSKILAIVLEKSGVGDALNRMLGGGK